LNIKIHGAGLGGCDVIIKPGQTDNSDCNCLWGTLDYAFCAYAPGRGFMTEEEEKELTLPKPTEVAAGRCPIVTGETLVCSDLATLGNCYDKGYSCSVESNGLCHCKVV
jgi:hypothetical protein